MATYRIALSGKWATAGNSHASGYAFHGDEFLDDRAIASLLDRFQDQTSWITQVQHLNGCFAAIRKNGRRLFAAVDRNRTIPLFYSGTETEILVTDRLGPTTTAEFDASMNPERVSEFRLTGYCTGDATLVPGFHQIRAGHMLAWDLENSLEPKVVRYYSYDHGDLFEDTTERLTERLNAVHMEVFHRLVESAEGRPLVLPLSGGYDSRLIATSLKDMGIDRVTCYCYGRAGNWEARISRELAQYLGFQWEFVPYTWQRWAAWSRLKEYKIYIENAGNLSSIAHVQDWPAIYELSRSSRIPSDSIVIPGHSGDFLAGSHVPIGFAQRGSVGANEVVDLLLFKHYELWDWSDSDRKFRPAFAERIRGQLSEIPNRLSLEQAANLLERWNWEERQAKFINNSVRCYEYHGLEWRLPLWDYSLMDFWRRVPVQLRIGRALYFQFANRYQHLPIGQPNRDRPAPLELLASAVKRSGLEKLTRVARRTLRAARWRHEYESGLMAWFGAVDRNFFKNTYTGHETLHSYMARAQLDRLIREESHPPT